MGNNKLNSTQLVHVCNTKPEVDLEAIQLMMKHIEIQLQSSVLQISICFAGRGLMISSSIDPSYVLQHIRLRSFAVNFQLINLREVTGKKMIRRLPLKLFPDGLGLVMNCSVFNRGRNRS